MERDMDERNDVTIVGGGIVGLATAFQLLSRSPDLRVTVLEREQRVGQHQSSRNSGVLHAGLYYAPGSAKARWCIAGKLEMERFCLEHDVPVERRGKVVVAVRRSELPGLAALAERARTNGVVVEELDAAAVREHEPHVAGLAGLWSPATAVTDFGAVCEALVRAIEAAGGSVQTGIDVLSQRTVGDSVRLRSSSGDVESRAAITCAGLRSDRIAGLNTRKGQQRIVPFRGSWLVLDPQRSHLVRSNIYPVPVGGGLPFLGVHLTRRIDGQIWIGPNAVLALAREGARPWSVDGRDLRDSLTFPGLWRLAATYPRVAASEVWRDRFMAATIREVQRYVPEIALEDVRRGPWGVRAQLVGRDGRLVDDFSVHEEGRVLHVVNAPSPAATASLAIGTELATRIASWL
jgi:(S)-2-hydroxyglutarate dehydrogenase